MFKRIMRRVRPELAVPPEKLFPLRSALPVPLGMSEDELFEFVTSVRVADAPEHEMLAYGTHDFRRFVYTLGLVNGLEGKCLELSANPYFTTLLLERFTKLELSLANYFYSDPNQFAISLSMA